ncbi:unnamed protein product [Cylindrotheca closterium]|uniref:Uncharacterized protein n=1 Tax=Cylindrotheca closterium TaxID=2856 RepID=A0AAD2FM84_9STRA|nr:unnamed protein product [Cylindrotheca closterium]
MDIRKPTTMVGKSGKRFSRPSLKGAKLLGSSVRSALGSTASFRLKQTETQGEDSDTDSGFFHVDEDVRKSAMEMFWSQQRNVTKYGKSIDDEELSSTGFSDSLSGESAHSLVKSAHTTKTAVHRPSNKEMNLSIRSTLSAKTLDPSDLRRGKCKTKKVQAPKRIDFTGNIVDSDDEDDDGDNLSRKSKSSKGSKKKKKSKKKSLTKKRKKMKKGVRMSIPDVSDDDAVVGGSSYEDLVDGLRAFDGLVASGKIVVQGRERLASEEETKVEDDHVADLITMPKPPSVFQRQTTSGTAASAFSADPSITHVMERIALEDEKYSDRQVRLELEQEVKELLEENDDLHADLDDEYRRNEKLQAELKRMETKLQTTQLQPLKQDDMELLHEEIQCLQEELNYEREASEKLSRESRSEIVELQQTVDNLREEVSLASISFSKSFDKSGLNISIHSDTGKSIDRLQGELLIANGKVESLEKVRMEQQLEVRKLRHLLDRFKENTGVKELEEKLEASEKEGVRLRLELEHVEKDWEEKMRSKEQTIDYFMKEVAALKLIQPSRTLTQTEVQDVLRVGPEELATDTTTQTKRFSWLRGSRREI